MSVGHSFWRPGIVMILCGCLCQARAAEPTWIAHWPLAADARDVGPHKLETKNLGATFETPTADADGHGVARFAGLGKYLAVDDIRALANLSLDEFTIALWIKTDDRTDVDIQQLVSWRDPGTRTGFELSLRTNTGVTTCQSNARQLQFGIDAGTEPRWRDEGRPGDNSIAAFALAVHDGSLYAGTCEPGKDEAGRVYRYEAPGKWTDLGSPDKCNAISAMAEHQGRLYVGSAQYRLAGSALPESENPHAGGNIFRLESDGRWEKVGRLGEDQTAVGGMVFYRGELYVTSLYRPAGFYRYESDNEWTSLATPDGLRVESLGVYGGYLWASSYDGGYVFRYDGETWKSYGQVGDNTQTYSFASYRNDLYVGTWPSGRVYRLSAKDDSWEDVGRLGDEKEVMGMLVHNGSLYAGTLPLAEVYRYDGGTSWTKVARLDHTPDVTYRRAWTMAQCQGRLFVSTLPSGRIHSMEVGKCVTHDRSLKPGWTHIVAVKQRDRLRLYVDGTQVAESTRIVAPLADQSVNPNRGEKEPKSPLIIGGASGDAFCLRDVRIYASALTPAEIDGLLD